MSNYYARDGRRIDNAEAMRLFGSGNDERTVARDQVGDASVSTVHLVIDHSFGGPTPIIFETMIFGGPYDEWMDRYATEAQAKAGHRRVLAALREGRAPEGSD